MFSFFRRSFSTISRRFPPRHPLLPPPLSRKPRRFAKASHARSLGKIHFRINSIYTRLTLIEGSLNSRIEDIIAHCLDKKVKEIRTEDLTPTRKTLLDRYSKLQGFYNLVKSGISGSVFAEKAAKDGVKEALKSWYRNNKNPGKESMDQLSQLSERLGNLESVSKDRHEELKTLLNRSRSKGLTRTKSIGGGADNNDEGEGDTTDGEEGGGLETTSGVGIGRMASRVVTFIVSWFSNGGSGGM